MNNFRRSPKKGTSSAKQLGRKSKNAYTTKSGQTIKVNRSLGERIKAHKDYRSRLKAKRRAGMPKGRMRGLLYRMHPKRLYAYWFSREGGIMALKVAGVGIIASFLMMIGVFAYFRKDLPDLRDISGRDIGGSIRYFDRTGEILLWEDYDAVKRIPVPDDDINDYVKDATVAIEDKDFSKHGGFDLRGIARASLHNVSGSEDPRQGGSTLTQQLVRLTQAGVGSEQTYKRKVKELILSIELERSFSKQEILTGYLNAAPYGNVQYGVEAATRDYFQKGAKDLTLDEAAFLAAIPKAPSYYSPYGPNYNADALVGRQHYVLDLMEQQNMITREERDAAKKVETLSKVKAVKPKYAGIKAPWFVLTAKSQLEAEFGGKIVSRGGWKVITTLDMKLQKIAEEKLAEGMPQVQRQGGDTAAFVAEDVKTGQVVALVGGPDFTNEKFGQNNYARHRLPPGSSIKPYSYLALMEHHDNFGAGSVLFDTQGPIDGYPCTDRRLPRHGGNCLWNFDFRHTGPLTLRYALGGSRNIPAVKAMMITGVDKTIETVNKLMGNKNDGYKCFYDDSLTKEAPCYASSGIGDGAYLRLDEHVHGYATISRNGVELPRTYILKIDDAANKTVKQWEPNAGKQAVRPDSAYITADMMADPRASYFSQKIHNFNGHKFSVKTGTTNDAKDGWMLGFSTQYSAGVWVGSSARQTEMSGAMENMTMPIWNGWMTAAHEGLQPEERKRPEGVKSLPAFVVRQHVGFGSIEPSPSTDLFPGWYQQQKPTSNVKRTIDIVSNKLATDCTPPRAKKEIFETDANAFSGDTFVNPGAGTNFQEKDNIHKCEDVKPSVSLSIQKISTSNRYRITANYTQGTHPLSSSRFPGTLNIKIDGRVLPGGTYTVSSSGTKRLTYTATFSGTKSVVAEIIDSVLYDSTDTATITVTGAPPVDCVPEEDDDCDEEVSLDRRRRLGRL
ncbi:hypothetical protein BH23PAT1_BH23PAT1_3770 [soil metagenome]